MKKNILSFFILLFFCAGCATSTESVSSTDGLSSTILFSEEISSENIKVAEWISFHIRDFKSKYAGLEGFELIFVDLGDDDVPDMIVRTKHGYMYYTAYDSVGQTKELIHRPIADVFENNCADYTADLVERNGIIGGFLEFHDIYDYNYFLEQGDIEYQNINIADLSPDDYVEMKRFATESWGDMIFTDEERWGFFSVVSTLPNLFFYVVDGYTYRFFPQRSTVIEMEEDRAAFVEKCYYSDTGLYGFYTVEMNIVEMLSEKTDYPRTAFDGRVYNLLPRDDYEKLLAEYKSQFIETEFPWIYRSGWKEGYFTLDWLDNVEKEANESYETYLSKK